MKAHLRLKLGLRLRALFVVLIGTFVGLSPITVVSGAETRACGHAFEPPVREED